ncbi:GerW family sporulation protein [Clostridium niameyense]|uniref:GerW family sporulation protein n=1 Tax=Clostridium niameyense TaxID=1622073 RepID=UPI00067EE9FF|nr:spore germination protein GerW family protein [Clostridium niameyense]
MDNNYFNDNMNTIFTKVEDFVKKESTMGAPVNVENKTLIPIVSVTLGYGNGTCNSKAKNSGSSTPPKLGLGTKICTDAVIVIDKDDVSMLPVTLKSNANQVMTKLPDVVSTLKQNIPMQNMGMGMNQNAQQNAQQNTTTQSSTTSSTPQNAKQTK